MRMMMFNDNDFAIGEPRAQFELHCGFRTGRKGSRQRYAPNLIGADAADCQRHPKGFVRKRSWPVLPRYLCLLYRRSNSPIRDYAAGCIAEQPADSKNYPRQS
jgi:hypothetical protein